MYSVVPHLLVSKSVFRMHSIENEGNFAVGYEPQFNQGLVWASGTSDSGL